jgi:hypothetical protein
VDTALSDFQTSKDQGGLKSEFIAPYLADHFALSLALLNRPAEAHDALAHAPATSRATLAKAVRLEREGDAAGARKALACFEVKQLGGVLGALGRTVDLMSLERLTGELRPVDRVALFGETGSDALRKLWPELVDFVERAPVW